MARLQSYRRTPTVQKQFSAGLRYLPETLVTWNVNTFPDYQRGYVWSDENCSLFMGYYLAGGAVPPIWLNENEVTHECEVIDGKQRLHTIGRWTCNESPATMQNGDQLFYRDLTSDDLAFANAECRLNFNVVRLSRVEVLQFYLALNFRQVPHTRTDLEVAEQLLKHEMEKGS